MDRNNYERTILEVLERVGILEEQVITLREQQESMLKEKTTEQNETSKVYSALGKDAVIETIKENAKPLGIVVEKASIAKGGGVIIKYKEDKEKRIMLRRSKNYSEGDFDWRGWHTVNHEYISDFDGFIFTIEKEGELHFFIFNKQEFDQILSLKSQDKSGNIHFYFNKFSNKITDDRDDDNIDISSFYNNWESLKQ